MCNLEKYGFDIVIRDHMGSITTAKSSPIPRRINNKAEALALLYRLVLAKPLLISHLHVEGDLKVIINARI